MKFYSLLLIQLIFLMFTLESRKMREPPPARLPAKQFVVLSTYDVKAQKFRGKKENAFIFFTDSLLGMIAEDIRRVYNSEAEVIRGILTGDTAAIFNLIKQHHADHAIVVTSFDVYFVQREVDVTKTDEGKDRIASYDICSTIEYTLYDKSFLLRKDTVSECEFHSHRKVVSGLLAGGPGIAGNKQDAIKIIRSNAGWYLRNHVFSEKN